MNFLDGIDLTPAAAPNPFGSAGFSGGVVASVGLVEGRRSLEVLVVSTWAKMLAEAEQTIMVGHLARREILEMHCQEWTRKRDRRSMDWC